MTSTADTVGASSLGDDDPGWCPQRKGDMLCSRDWGHWGQCRFTRPIEQPKPPRCSFSRTETAVLRLGPRRHTQVWTFTCVFDAGHKGRHAFSAIPDGAQANVDVPRSHWRRMRAERRRLE